MLLTKSKYLMGMQCPRYFWTAMNDKNKIPDPDERAQFIFRQGTEVGELATKLYPEGVEVPFDDFKTNLEKSKELLSEGKPLFEAGFKFGDCYSRADILVPAGDEWDIVEVKSGTSVKEVNLHDVAFQKYCYEGCGLKIRNCYVMHLNNKYIRNGELDLEELFSKRDITSEVEELYGGIESKVNELLEVMKSGNIPEADIGPRCKSPYACPLTECWDFLPENHVFHLYRGGKKSLELFEDGIQGIKDIPEDFKLNDKQGIQRDCDLNDKVHVDKKNLKGFLDGLKYPLQCLDFESFQTAVPMFDGCKPYEQICFQYSLHIVDEEGNVEHKEFLYDGSGDPREEFISTLKEDMLDSGSVLVYNQNFEKSKLEDLKKLYPAFSDFVDGVNSRVVDLWVPFRKFDYYNSVQKGSASLKFILPALVGKDYSDLDISGGELASLSFFNVNYLGIGDKTKVRNDLLEYCKMDTLAEVLIVDKLKELV